jgi:hypothetical protein
LLEFAIKERPRPKANHHVGAAGAVAVQLDHHHHQGAPIAIARKWAKKFFAAYEATRDPLDIKRKGRLLKARPPTSFTSAGPTNWITI